MSTYLPSLVLVIVAIIGVVGTWISNRNDRAQALQELEILRQLKRGTDFHTQVAEIVGDRIKRWHGRIRPWNIALRKLIFAMVGQFVVLQLLAILSSERRSVILAQAIQIALWALAAVATVATIYFAYNYGLALKERRALRYSPASSTEGQAGPALEPSPPVSATEAPASEQESAPDAEPVDKRAP